MPEAEETWIETIPSQSRPSGPEIYGSTPAVKPSFFILQVQARVLFYLVALTRIPFVCLIISKIPPTINTFERKGSRIRYNYELYELYDELEVSKFIKLQRIQ